MPYGIHIYPKASDMENETMCTNPHYDNALPHWKCILRCFANCPCNNLPDQETTKKLKKQHPQLGFTFITALYVVLLMVEFHWKKRKSVSCVNNNLYQIHLQKYTPEKNPLWWRQQYLIFIPVSTYQPSKSWLFTYHMCAFLVKITVVKCDTHPSNIMNYFKMFYFAMIILRE